LITWLGAVPGFLAAGALLLTPGAFVALAWRRRGLVVLLLAPPLSLAAIAFGSVVAPLVALRWSLAPLVVTSFVFAVPGLVLQRLARDRPTREKVAVDDAHGTWRWVLGGGAVAGALGALTFSLGIGRPDAVSQSYDAVFHLNALRYIEETGSSSPFHLQSMINASGLYPSVWHALASLVIPVVSGSIPAAANLSSLAVVVVVWPLGCVLLVRQLLGPMPMQLAAAAVLSMGFVSFPWFVLSWGVLWPNTLGIALIPAVLGCLLSALGAAERDVLGGPAAGVLALGASAVACAAAHPGAFISAVVLGSVVALVVAVQRAVRWSRRGNRRAAGVGQLLATVLVVAVGWAVLYRVPGVLNTTTDWPATTTVPAELVRHLVGGPDNTAPEYAVSALVLVGAVRCLRCPRLCWLVPAYLVSIGLDVVAAGIDSPLSEELTGFWYNDRYRLAAVVPVTGVALAVVGLGTLVTLLLRLTKHRWTWAGPVPVLGVLILVGAVSGGYGIGAHANFLAIRYLHAENDPSDSLVSPAEQQFLSRLGDYVPPNALVAGTPWDGSSLAWALGDRKVLYPYFAGRRTAAEQYVADHLRDATTDPAVCPAVRQTGVQYVLSLGATFSPPLLHPGGYLGLHDLSGDPGFELVVGDGAAQLYKITACG